MARGGGGGCGGVVVRDGGGGSRDVDEGVDGPRVGKDEARQGEKEGADGAGGVEKADVALGNHAGEDRVGGGAGAEGGEVELRGGSQSGFGQGVFGEPRSGVFGVAMCGLGSREVGLG